MNSGAPVQQHTIKHQPHSQHNNLSFQQIPKMQVNQQQNIIQHSHSHTQVSYTKQNQIKNHTVSNQHELVKQAARAAALAPTTNNRNPPNKQNAQGKSNSIPVIQRSMPLNSSQDFATANDPLSIHASMSNNPQIPSVNNHTNPRIGMPPSPLRGNPPNTSSKQPGCK